ncbi:TPA: hypothetical protein H1005_04285, partial [archaeon]|nr:hypothetical protein [Candidatus Naiadarchaeales archaeon SRR2090153.bin1042]
MDRIFGKGVVGIIVGLVLLVALPALASAAPDVTITGITVSPSTTDVNEVSTVTATVQNIGDVTSTGTWVEFLITRGTSIIDRQNITGLALDPMEVQPVSIQWTPFATGTHTILVTAGVPADPNTANDATSTNVNVGAGGIVQIKNYFVTPTLVVDSNGCPTLSPLEISGFVQEDNVGTSDGVLIYVDNDLVDFVRASSAQDGLFESSVNDVCFEEPGTYNVTANVDRGSGTIATATDTVNVLFLDEDGSGTTPTQQNLVDVEALPRILRVGAGEFSEFLLSIENLGRTTDTYEIKVNAQSEIDPWIDLETNLVTVSPGQTKFVSLFVDVPRNTSDDSHPINVIVQGKSTDIDRLYLVVENAQSTSSTAGGVKPDYAVDVEIAPQGLSLEAEDSGQYVVTVENVGLKTDTYELNVLTSAKIASWFRLEKSKITLATGEKQQIKLFVDAPEDAPSKSYPVTIEADGVAIDLDRASLTTVRKVSGFDVEVGKASVSPQKVPSEPSRGVAVKGMVSFFDLTGESAGESVFVRLYVNGQQVESQSVFIPSGDSKQVSFTLDTENDPVSSEPGVYDVYLVGSVGQEVDRGASATLTLVQPGAAVITGITPVDLNTSANKDVSLTLTIKNTDLQDNTYVITADSIGGLAGRVDVSPGLMSVAKSETRTQELKLSIGNAPDDSYPVTIRIGTIGTTAEKTVTVNVKGGQIAEPVIPTGGNQTGGGGVPTGFISLTVGGIFAAIVGAMLLAFLYAQYYKTRKLEEIAKEPVEGAEEAMEEVLGKEEV